MIKWIRWQGLVAFVVVVGGIVALWLLFADSLVKYAVEKSGTAIVGAEVDVKAKVKLFPLSVTLTELQVTDPNAPARNSVECKRIAFSLDTLNLFRHKVIINEMAMEGVRFDTARKRPGVVKRPPEEKKAEQKKAEEKPGLFGLPIEKPDVKKILANEHLESVALIEQTRADLQKKKADWQQRIDQLPNKAKLDAYKVRIDKLKQASRGNLLGAAGELGEVRALRRDLEQDIENVKNTKNAFTSDLASAKALVAKAEKAPLDDVRKLRDKYSISPEGIQNMSRLLFGNQISSWVRSGLAWYNRLQPLVERAKQQKGNVKVVKHLREKGVDVRFREYRPLPDFLVGRSAVSVETAVGNMAGTIMNITPDQDILGKPLTLLLSGEKLPLAKSMALSATVNHIIPARPDDTARFSTRGFMVKDLVLSGIKELPISLQEGLLDFDLDGTFTHTLSARLKANVNSAKMMVGGEPTSNLFVTAVRSALSKVTKFTLAADVTGTLEDYTMKISSDLDTVLKNAVGSVVKEQSAKLEKDLKTAIAAKTSGPLKDLQDSFGGLNQDGGKIDSVQSQLNALLQDAIKSAGGGKLKLP